MIAKYIEIDFKIITTFMIMMQKVYLCRLLFKIIRGNQTEI